MSKKIFLILLSLISIIYLFLRFYNLGSLLSFRYDQALFITETKSIIESGKIQLLGPPTSKTFQGRYFYVGSGYYYLLGLIGLISQWNPLLITGIFIGLEFIFYIFFILFLRTKFNNFLILLVFLSIAISPYLVAHSRFFWNPHCLIPLSIMLIYFLDKFLKKLQFRFLFMAALFWGLSFNCHYSPIFWGIMFLYVLVKSKIFLKLKSYLAIFFGVFIGDLFFFIF